MPGSDDYADSAPPLGFNPADVKPTSNAAPNGENISASELGLVPQAYGRAGFRVEALGKNFRTQAEAQAAADAALPAAREREANIRNLTNKILQQSTYDKWTGQAFGSVQANARHMASRMADAGITRLEDLGQRSKTVQEYYEEPGSEPGYGGSVRDVAKYEFYNKATGQTVAGDQQSQNVMDITYAGDGSTQFNVTFNNMGMPVFYTSYNGSSSDWGTFAPILAFASIIPSPIQPFAQAINAAVAFDQGNIVGGVLGALGAAYSFGAQYNTLSPSSLNYVNSMDAASDVAAGVSSSSTIATAANWLAANAGTIRTAQQAAGLLNALDKKNLAGIIAGLNQISPEIGVSIPESAVKAIQTAAVGSAMAKGDWAGASLAASTLLNSSDLRLASRAIRVADAVKSENPQAIFTSFVSFAQDSALGSKAVKDAAKKAGVPMSDKTAEEIYNAADADAHVREYYKVVSDVRKSYKDIYGEVLTDDLLDTFAENGGIIDGFKAYVDDQNTTSQSELESMLSKAGLTTKDLSADNIFEALALTENSAQRYIDRITDIRKNSFDGSKFDTKEAAAAAAIKDGFNTFIAPDGETYNVIPGDVAKKIVTDAGNGKNVGIDANNLETINGVPLRDLKEGEAIPEVVITATKLDKPSPADAEAWAKYQQELKDLGGASFSKFFRDQLDILTEAFKDTKPDTFADGMKNALAFGARNFGSLTSNLLRGAEALGLDKNSAALRTTQALERWGKTNQSSGILDAEGQFTNAINSITKESIAAKLGKTPDKVSSVQVAAEQMRELGRQAVNNPLGTFSVGLGEGVQEVPFLVVSGGVGSVASKILSKAGAFAVARGTDAALNGFESFSGNYAEVKDFLEKNGYSDGKSEARAIASGLEAMGVTMLTSWVGDKAVVKAFMGDLAKDSVSRIAGAGAKEYVMGYVEGGMQNASAQIGKYGEVRNMAEVTAAGTIEGFIQAGLTTGVLSADKLSTVVARDYDGKGVTLGSILDGTSTFDPGSMNSNFELTAGFTIGDTVNYNKTFAENPNITPVEYMKTAEFFRAEGLTPTPQNIAEIVGGETDLTGDDLQKTATTYADQNYVTSAEAKQMLSDIGYQNPSQDQVDQFTGNKVESGVKTEIANWVDQNTVTQEEAIQQLKDLGYVNPPDTLINKLVGQYDQSQLPTRAENLGVATKQDVVDAIANIKLPSGLSKDDVATAISDYMEANPGLTADDLDSAISAATKDLATAEQIENVQKDIDALEGLIGSPSGEDAEATGIIGKLEAMGLTDSQILEVIGSPATEDGEATGLYKVAEDAAVRGEDAAAAVQAGLENIIGNPSVKDDPATLDVDESLGATGLYKQIEDSQEALSADVQEKYDALSEGQKALADQLNQQGIDLRTAIDLAAQQTQQQVLDLGTQLNTRVDELVAQGKTQYEATQQAIAEVNQQNQQLQGLVGTQGRAATQQDIDALNQMLSGQRSMDLAYDVNRDNQITQDDLAFLQSVVAGTNPDWNAPTGTIWGGTGLYGQIAANEAQRQADLRAAEIQRQKDVAAQQEANRQAAIRTTAGQAGTQIQQIMGQLPQAVRGLQTTTTPIYGGEMTPFDLSAPLDVDFFSPSKEKQGSQTGQQTTKIATGGYLDDLLDLLR